MARKRPVVGKVAVGAARGVWWLICLPFVAFEVLGSKIVPPPVDARQSLDEIGRERDLRVESLANAPPSNAG